MHAKTLRQAEKTAIEGTNESQDTLLLAHHLMMDFGVGLVSGVDNPSSSLSASRECDQSDYPGTVQRSSSPTGDFMSLPSPNRSRPMGDKASKSSKWPIN
jgi:hypothetical protein